MKNHKTSIVVTLVLGIISLLYLIAVVLSLLDIYKHQEPDLSEEWGVVVMGLLLFVLLSFTAIFTTIRLLRQNTKLS